MTVSDMLEKALRSAMEADYELHKRWVALMHRFAATFGDALARHGETRIDLLLRRLEDERMPRLQGPGKIDIDFSLDLQISLSNAWVLSIHDALAAIPAAKRTERTKSLFEVFRLVRIPLAKAQIAQDDRLTEVPMMTPWGESKEKAVPYEKRRYIVATGIDPETGSVCWHPFDVASGGHVIVPRRALSDAFLALFD